MNDPSRSIRPWEGGESRLVACAVRDWKSERQGIRIVETHRAFEERLVPIEIP